MNRQPRSYWLGVLFWAVVLACAFALFIMYIINDMRANTPQSFQPSPDAVLRHVAVVKVVPTIQVGSTLALEPLSGILDYLCPCPPSDYFPDAHLGDSVQCAKFTLEDTPRSIALTDCTHVILGEFRTDWRPHTTLTIRIEDIISVCTQKEVVRVGTRRIITEVEDKQADRDRAIMYRPRDTVGLCPYTMLPPLVNTPITITICLSHPQPTGIGIVRNRYLRPEAGYQRGGECDRLRLHREPLFPGVIPLGASTPQGLSSSIPQEDGSSPLAPHCNSSVYRADGPGLRIQWYSSGLTDRWLPVELWWRCSQ